MASAAGAYGKARPHELGNGAPGEPAREGALGGRATLDRHFDVGRRPRSADAVLPEPGKAAGPAVLGRGLIVRGAVVGVEAVIGFGVDLQLGGLAGLADRLPHPFDRGYRDALVLAAVEAQHRGLELVHEVDRVPGAQWVGVAGQT